MAELDGSSHDASYEEEIVLLDEMFKDRYTETDPDYVETIAVPLADPPCVENWFIRPKRQWDNRGRGHRGGRGDYQGRNQYGNQRNYNQRGHRGNYHGYHDNRRNDDGYHQHQGHGNRGYNSGGYHQNRYSNQNRSQQYDGPPREKYQRQYDRPNPYEQQGHNGGQSRRHNYHGSGSQT